MKSKTKLFLLPMLAVAVMVCAAFGFASFNNAPAKVSADGEMPVYFYNYVNWENIYVHYWGGASESEWPGTKMTDENGDGWFEAELPSGTSGIIFNNFAGTQTVNINFNSSSPYYYVNGVDNDKKTCASAANATRTIYFYNSQWTNGQLYAFTDGGNHYNYNFDDSKDTWVSQEIPTAYEKGIFRLKDTWGGAFETRYNQSFDITWSSSNTYFMLGSNDGVNYKWNVKSYTYQPKSTTEGFYLYGSFNSWHVGDSTYALSHGDTEYINGLYLTEGTTMKIVYCGAEVQDTDYSDEYGNNSTINANGYYNVYLDKGTNPAQTRYNTCTANILTTLHKTATDKHYVLFITGFYLADYTDGVDSIGYDASIGGAEKNNYGTTYYSSVTIGGNTYTAAELYGAQYTGYKLIVYEAECASGNEVTAQAFVMNGATPVLTGTAIAGTIGAGA